MENYLELTQSLVEKLKDKSLTPRERVDTCIKLQKYYMFFDYTQAIKYAKLGSKEAIKSSDTQAEYICKTNEAICLYELKQYEKSLRILFENKEHFEKTDNIDAINFVLLNIGKADSSDKRNFSVL